MNSLAQLKCESLNSIGVGIDNPKTQEIDSRPSIPSIELLICEEEELKKNTVEVQEHSTKRQEHFRHRNTPDSNIRRPAALQIRKNPGLSRFGQEHQRAMSQNKICAEEKKIETVYPASHNDLLYK